MSEQSLRDALLGVLRDHRFLNGHPMDERKAMVDDLVAAVREVTCRTRPGQGPLRVPSVRTQQCRRLLSGPGSDGYLLLPPMTPR